MRKRAISRYVAAALSASMAAPAAAPAVQVFAKELSETADVTDSGKATPSDADPDDGDVLIADGDILPDDEEEATPSDAEEIIADVEIADSTQKKSDYPVFGTSAFWAWMDSLFTDKDEEGNVDLTSEDAKAAILAWHATIAKSSVATASDAEKNTLPSVAKRAVMSSGIGLRKMRLSEMRTARFVPIRTTSSRTGSSMRTQRTHTTSC